MLKEIFIKLLAKYTIDTKLIEELWREIEESYSNKKRHYHTLSHLDNLFKQLLQVEDKIESWETVLFTLFYHDVIYNALLSDNEEQSSELAEKRMRQINVPSQIIENCKAQILATKKHIRNSDSDTNYFIDADLAILGSDSELYKLYSAAIRSEFLYYPSIIYNSGRVKVLEHFQSQNEIYKTEYFFNKFEKTAKANILHEIKELSRVRSEYFLTYSNQWNFSIEEDGNFSEFLYYGVELLDQMSDVEKITYYPGFFDSGYYRFYYKKVKLNLEWEGMLGVDLKTEANPSELDLIVAREMYEILKQIRNKNYA